MERGLSHSVSVFSQGLCANCGHSDCRGSAMRGTHFKLRVRFLMFCRVQYFKMEDKGSSKAQLVWWLAASVDWSVYLREKCSHLWLILTKGGRGNMEKRRSIRKKPWRSMSIHIWRSMSIHIWRSMPFHVSHP